MPKGGQHTIERGHGLPAPDPLARHFGLDPAVVFLNHGSFGACPTAVLEKQDEIRRRMEREPVRFFVEDLEGLMDRAREALARFIRADAAGLVRVHNATEGVNTVLAWLDLKPGDEVVTSAHEYNACNNALRAWCGRAGAGVVEANVPWPVRDEGEVVEAVLGAVTPRTRLVLLSHVTSNTGVVFPAAEIVRALRERGVETLVDGAHAPGMLPLDVDAMGAAYYTGNCHKWLCAPKGAAFLWVREDLRAKVRPLSISHGANSPRRDRSMFRLEFDYTGTDDCSAFLVVPDAIAFMDGLLPGGWPEVILRNRENAIKAREVLCAALGSEPPAPVSMVGAMAAAVLPDRTPEEAAAPTKYHDGLQDRLIEKWGIQAPVMVHPPGSARRLVRVSMQVYNSLAQVEYLGRALRAELGREHTG